MPSHSSARQSATQIARAELERYPVYLDTETTGLDEWDEIVDICVLDAEGHALLDSLVKPKCEISTAATAVHGLTNAMVANALAWPELWPQVEAVLAGQRVAVYNAAFDLKMMAHSHRAHGMHWTFPESNFFCVMLLYAQFKGDWNPKRRAYRWHSLEEAGRQCRIPLPNAHRAREDAALARAVLHHMAGR
ncbi:MAG: 3'-5' exonuclease [Anaerolineales bacterium]